MKSKSVVSLVLVAITLVSGVVLLAFWPSGESGRGAVYMPGRVDEDEGPAVAGAEENLRKIEAVVIGRGNVLDVLSTLARPETYQLSAVLTYTYTGALGEAESQDFTVTVKAEPGRSKTVLGGLRDGVRMGVHTLQAGGRTYIWEDGADSAYEGSSGSFGVDDFGHMPRYEDLLSLGSGAVTDGYLDSERACVVVETLAPDTGYAERWSISIRDGLLLDYTCQAGGVTVFSATVHEVRTGGAGMSDSDFALPDGTVPAV